VPDYVWGLLGVLAAAIVIAVYLVLVRWLENGARKKARKSVEDALGEPDSLPRRAEVGALLYRTFAGVATVDYEADPDLREFTAQVLEKARRAAP
jgi:hypothetical protein